MPVPSRRRDAFAWNLWHLPRDVVMRLTGRAVHMDDVRLDAETVGVVGRSPHPHVHIRTIDAAAARSAPGVLAVLTRGDVGRLTRRSLLSHRRPLVDQSVSKRLAARN